MTDIRRASDVINSVVKIVEIYFESGNTYLSSSKCSFVEYFSVDVVSLSKDLHIANTILSDAAKGDVLWKRCS